MGMKKVLSASLDTIAPVIDERTVLLIDLPVDTGNGDGSVRVYTFAALFVGGNWYVTGEDRLLATRYDTTINLLSALARFPKATVSLVTETEVVRG